eukprot:270444-Rhodomonas_salina.1
MPADEVGETTRFEVRRKAGPGAKTGVGMMFEKRSWEPYFRITGVPADVSCNRLFPRVDCLSASVL